ncbi:MAG: hypothetical protein JWP91_669 [Fibrobacteres bacterium]|nr:hypothetical protein [Fibrobacterota bacterium]
MKKSTIALAGLFSVAAAVASAEDAPKVVYKPLAIGALQEFGQLGRGIYKTGPTQPGEVWTYDWIDHFGAFLTKEAVVNDRLFLTGGIGGIFQFRKPEVVDAGFPGSQHKGFFLGPTKAMADYHFGDPENPKVTLGAGMFMYKYNDDASDLGEYLYRSGAYPNYTVTGGYLLVNSAAANLQGLKSSLHFGNFKADLLLTTETSLAPLYDWSLGAIAGYSIAGGLLDLGAGVNFKRLIQVKPSRTSPHTDANGYLSVGGKYYSTNLNYYDNQSDFYTQKGTAEGTAKAAEIQAQRDMIDSLLDPNRTPIRPEMNYYTSAGIIMMAKASLDFKKLFASDLFGPQDLKLYTEAALLGLKDYPVFYTKKSERMPIMVGFNFPGFHFLDLISVQAEQFKSPWLNNTAQIANQAIPLPHFPIKSDLVASEKEWNDLATKDDLKWSILVQKKIGGYITWSAQAANDHMRLVSSRYYYGPQYDHNEITVSKKDWYWMTQLSWGI